jgi:hypothetical protein
MRKLCTAILGLALLLALVGDCLARSHHPKPKPQSKTSPLTEQQRPAQPSPPADPLTQQQFTQSITDGIEAAAKQYEASHPTAPPDNSSWLFNLLLTVFTGGLVVVGGAQCYLIFRTLKATEIAANAAEALAQTTTDEVHRSHRAWVGLFGQPEITEPLTFDAAGAHIAIRLNIKNVGESPAFHIVLMSPRLFVSSPQRDPRTFIADVNLELARNITETAGILALPSDPIPWTVVRPQSEILDRDNLPVRVWFSGFFAYRDEFNRIHTSSFLFSYVASDGSREIQPVGISAGQFEPFGFGWSSD